MAVAFRSVNTITQATAGITGALPAGTATGDILLWCLNTANEAITVATPNGGTWTEFPDSPQSQGTAAQVAGNRLTVFWSRYNGTQTAPVSSDSGNYQIQVMLAYSGCATTGDPFDVTAGNTQAATVNGSIPGDTTTVDGCMIVAMAACDRDANSTTNATAWANASLASITERVDQVFGGVLGGGWAIADGIKTTAGTVSATTWTQEASANLCNLMVALKPEASGATGTVAVTQADQTSTASATETLTATSAQTQAAQTSAASGSVANPVTGTVAQTQANQTSTATGTETFTGTSANVQADQTSTASGSVGAAPITGTVSATQVDQTSTASGFSVQNLTGTVAVTQADQTSTATAVETFTGTLAETQDDQTSTATATFGFTGTAGVTQDNQTSTASGISAVTVTGTVAVTQQDQFSTATANGGTVTFWVPYPVGYVFNPVAYVSNPAGFVRVGPDSIPPAW